MDIARERHHSRSEWWLYLGNGTCPLGGIDVQKEVKTLCTRRLNERQPCRERKMMKEDN